MKFLTLLLLASVLCPLTSAPAQTNAPSTNTLSVVLDAGQDSLLRAAWKYDTELRTNGIPPYSNSLPAQTFRQYVESVSAPALERKAQEINRQREKEMLVLWRQATVPKQNKALAELRKP